MSVNAQTITYKKQTTNSSGAITAYSDVTSTWAQHIKSIDSLKTALSSEKTKTTNLSGEVIWYTGIIKKQSFSIDSSKTALSVEKVRSLTFQNEDKILNNQLSYFSFKTDSLIRALDHCTNPPMDSTTIKEILNQPVKYFALKDTAYKTDMHIEQNFYNCIPYYKYQYITRFPVQTSTGIRTKEIILTQVQ
jgi:hypothetical protein